MIISAINIAFWMGLIVTVIVTLMPPYMSIVVLGFILIPLIEILINYHS